MAAAASSAWCTGMIRRGRPTPAAPAPRRSGRHGRAWSRPARASRPPSAACARTRRGRRRRACRRSPGRARRRRGPGRCRRAAAPAITSPGGQPRGGQLHGDQRQVRARQRHQPQHRVDLGTDTAARHQHQPFAPLGVLVARTAPPRRRRASGRPRSRCRCRARRAGRACRWRRRPPSSPPGASPNGRGRAGRVRSP